MKTRLLDRLDRPFYRQLLVLAAPIMLQNFIASSLNMFDTLMIGQLGENEVAAVGVANQVFFLFNLVANGAAAGCSIFLSQFWGGGDRRSVHKVVGLGLLMNLCIGLLFTGAACAFPGPIIGLFSDDQAVISLGIEYLLLAALSYAFTSVSFLLAGAMRSVGKAWPPMIISAGAVLAQAYFPGDVLFPVAFSPVFLQATTAFIVKALRATKPGRADQAAWEARQAEAHAR